MAVCIRAIYARQPLLENYIDRQVHTAMIARNLQRGASLLYPEIDIGPFPAYYMLELPAYPAVAGVVAAWAGIELDLAGRLVSIAAMALACLALYDLVRRHDGLVTAVLAGVAMACMPVTVRYGRAFQPDSTMIALVVISVWSMDRWCERGCLGALAVAALAAGGALLLKVIAAYVLIPLAYLAWHRSGWSLWRRAELWCAVVVAVVPCAAWYVHAWGVAAAGATVSTPFWQAHKWIAPAALVAPATYRDLAYYVGLRVLTPIGTVLAAAGVLVRASGPRGMLFHVWLGSLATYFPILVRKLDHEHYYLALAAPCAVFMARALAALASAPLRDRLYTSGGVAATVLGAGLLASDGLAFASTFRTPSEWRGVRDAAAGVAACTSPGALVAGHSSVLFYADRRGFSFAYRPHEVRYLLGTWGARRLGDDPATLLEFYRSRGATHFVELLGTGRERGNRAFFAELRERYRVVREEPGVYLVIALVD